MSNPVLASTAWQDEPSWRTAAASSSMTVQGTALKSGFLVLLLLATFTLSWQQVATTHTVFGLTPGIAIAIGAITGLLAVLLTMFVKRLAMPCAIVYALAEGVVLGLISQMLEVRYPGIALNAAAFTTLTLGGMLMMYVNGWIRATPMFVRIVMGATIGLGLGMAALYLLGLFGIGTGIASTLHGNSNIGIIFSVVCVGLAAFNLVLDFDVIERGARDQLPKHMEWLGALGLLVTLVWLYIEIIRLLAKLRKD